jgi:hypothetical protein
VIDYDAIDEVEKMKWDARLLSAQLKEVADDIPFKAVSSWKMKSAASAYPDPTTSAFERGSAARARGEGHATPSILINRRSGPRTTAVER